jgi:hypothetical protein
MEQDLRLAGEVGQDLDLAPADAAHPEPEHLADRLLGRPASGDPLGSPTAVTLLGIGQHPQPEAIRKAGEDGDDAVDVDQVHPDLVAAHAWRWSGRSAIRR